MNAAVRRAVPLAVLALILAWVCLSLTAATHRSGTADSSVHLERWKPPAWPLWAHRPPALSVHAQPAPIASMHAAGEYQRAGELPAMGAAPPAESETPPRRLLRTTMQRPLLPPSVALPLVDPPPRPA